ncbi:YicC/YloC family endoribonuclease [Defluviitalea phaphyphila]|uniref:YicC/YloC family endoribonuclease n=1 Tax=Defluviitalea phaphyphila TaxID=1473580 RepID=UPI00072FD1CE|nr:YicC/YloC family endoribonuclease [Defluviitalea phaphyphila]
MIRSMTGYGRGESILDDKKFIVELRSLNHRYSDINIRIPRNINFLEEKVRNFLKCKISRGKIDVFISFESNLQDNVEISLNETLVDAYINELNKIKLKSGVIDDISVSLIAKFPDVIMVTQKEEDEDFLWNLLKQALDKALDAFIFMREKEGEKLKQDLLYKISECEKYLENIKKRSPYVVKEYREKLEKRIEEILPNNSLDQNRIMEEVVLFAEKCSIDEEVIRLGSHIDQFREILNTEDVVGRKLDFLVQEMNREVNTIGTKANDLSITRFVIELKSEIEKIREQIQNIE